MEVLTGSTCFRYLERYHDGDDALLEQYESIRAALDASASSIGQEGEASSGEEQKMGVYVSEEVVDGGIKAGVYFSGMIRVDKHHQAEATVTTGLSALSADGKGGDVASEILILGDVHRNHAVHGDSVAVELLPKDQWQARTATLKLVNVTNTTTSAHEGASRSSRAVPTGRVVRILQRNWRTYAATLQEGEDEKHSGKMALAIPMVRLYFCIALWIARMVLRVQ